MVDRSAHYHCCGQQGKKGERRVKEEVNKGRAEDMIVKLNTPRMTVKLQILNPRNKPLNPLKHNYTILQMHTKYVSVIVSLN